MALVTTRTFSIVILFLLMPRTNARITCDRARAKELTETMRATLLHWRIPPIGERDSYGVFYSR